MIIDHLGSHDMAGQLFKTIDPFNLKFHRRFRLTAGSLA